MAGRRDADTLTPEEKRALVKKTLAGILPQWEMDEFDETFEGGYDRIRIGLKWFQIDPSEGLE